MHYVYVLQSKKDGGWYTGCTNNLRQRLTLHNQGQVESTRSRRPFQLIFYEAMLDKHDAFVREQWLKTGWGRNQLKKILATYIKNYGG
jgi:putative endonuclease